MTDQTFTLIGVIRDHLKRVLPNTPVQIVPVPDVSTGDDGIYVQALTVTTDAEGRVTDGVDGYFGVKLVRFDGLQYMVSAPSVGLPPKTFTVPAADQVLDLKTIPFGLPTLPPGSDQVLADLTAALAAEVARATTAEGTKVNSSTYTAGLGGKEPAIAAPGSAPTSKYWRGDKSWQDLATDPGLIAAFAARWQATHAYLTNDLALAPDGKIIQRNANGTSRGSYDATEQAAWTVRGGSSALVRTTVKSANYSAVAGDLIPVDPSGAAAAITVLLPTAPPDKTQVGVKMILALGAGSSLTVATGGSDVFNRTSGATSMAFLLIGQGALYQYDAASATWTVEEFGVPLSQLDGRFVKVGDVTDAAAADIPFTPNGSIVATNVQAAVQEVRDEAVPLSIPTTKGDLLVATGAGTLVRLPVGANGKVLSADSSQAGGLAYADLSTVTDPDTYLGFAATLVNPHANNGVGTAGYMYFARVVTGFKAGATKIGLYVQTSSGNIMVGVYRSTGSGNAARPGSLAQGSVVTACPAVGYQEVSLAAAVDVAKGDYLALWCDNTTALFGALGNGINTTLKAFSALNNAGTGITSLPSAPSAGAIQGNAKTFALTAV